MILTCLSLGIALADPPLEPAAALQRLRDRLGAGHPSGVRVTSEVTLFDDGQSVERGHNAPTATSRVAVSWGEDGDFVRSTELQVGYPYRFANAWTERVEDGRVGVLDGADTFGGPRRQSMPGARLGMRSKERLLAVPAWLVAGVDAQRVEEHGDGLAIAATWAGGELTLITDATGERLEEVIFLEDQPPYSDVEVVVRYAAWAGDPAAPMRIEHLVDGRRSRLEVRSAVEPLEALDVVVRSDRVPPEDEVRFGWHRAGWLTDWIGFGFPQDRSPRTFDLELEEVARGVHLVTGEFHNALVVELGGDRLALVEAPFSAELAAALLDTIAARWPRGEVVAALATHHHLDHLGGIRAIAERGIPLWVPEPEVAWVTAVLERPATVIPRPSVTAPVVVGVTGTQVLEGRDRVVQVVTLPDNLHVSSLAVAWVPDAELLHVPDLLNPGLFPTRGPTGWVLRRVIDALDPYNLLKAGTYAASLEASLESAGLAPRAFTGGHGPQVGRVRDLEVLIRYADTQAYLATLSHPAE